MIFSFYEGINVERSHVYDRYIRVTDQYRSFSKRSKPRRTDKFGYLESAPTRIIHKLCHEWCDIQDTTTHMIMIEFKLLDDLLIKNILNHIGQYLIDRYIVEWKSGKYFLNRYKVSLSFVDGDIFIFNGSLYDTIDEVKLDRDMKISKLLCNG